MNFELKIPPVLVTLITILIAYVLAKAIPITIIDILYNDVVAGCFIFLGFVLILNSLFIFKYHETTANPLKPETSSTLVTTGTYKLSRNPIYLGLLLIVLGMIIYYKALSSIIIIPIFIWYMTQYQIIHEENAMKSLFGSEYENYYQRVRRWL